MHSLMTSDIIRVGCGFDANIVRISDG